MTALSKVINVSKFEKTASRGPNVRWRIPAAAEQAMLAKFTVPEVQRAEPVQATDDNSARSATAVAGGQQDDDQGGDLQGELEDEYGDELSLSPPHNRDPGVVSILPGRDVLVPNASIPVFAEPPSVFGHRPLYNHGPAVAGAVPFAPNAPSTSSLAGRLKRGLEQTTTPPPTLVEGGEGTPQRKRVRGSMTYPTPERMRKQLTQLSKITQMFRVMQVEFGTAKAIMEDAHKLMQGVEKKMDDLSDLLSEQPESSGED